LTIAPVEPHATALWTVVDFDALTLAHHKLRIFANRTLHFHLLESFWNTEPKSQLRV
jgi:hypothetical protein